MSANGISSPSSESVSTLPNLPPRIPRHVREHFPFGFGSSSTQTLWSTEIFSCLDRILRSTTPTNLTHKANGHRVFEQKQLLAQETTMYVTRARWSTLRLWPFVKPSGAVALWLHLHGHGRAVWSTPSAVQPSSRRHARGALLLSRGTGPRKATRSFRRRAVILLVHAQQSLELTAHL
jgi:hypothetical protein